MNKTTEAINKIKEILNIEEKVLDEVETVQAPSGEWSEYNIIYLIQESRVEMVQEILDTIKELK